MGILRGLYYGSYSNPKDKLWISGVAILLIMMGTAFMGYVLPWGQMSFWGATVITNLASAVPFIGNDIVVWFWGSFSVDVPTLNRFFALHYLFPFVLTGLVLIHLFLLHENKSSDPLGIRNLNVDRIPMSPYFLIKDVLGFVGFFIVFIAFVFFYPNSLGHPDNYILANPMVTPAHIVPEWYFLPFYAILRSIPDKLQGVILMLLSILIIAAFPFLIRMQTETLFVPKSGVFRPYYQILIRRIVFIFIFLGWIGGQPVEEPYVFLGRVALVLFLYFRFLLFSNDCRRKDFQNLRIYRRRYRRYYEIPNVREEPCKNDRANMFLYKLYRKNFVRKSKPPYRGLRRTFWASRHNNKFKIYIKKKISHYIN